MLIACGINHKTAPISLREKIAFSEYNLTDSLNHLIQQTDTREAVILTTCNRTEIYCNSEQPGQLLPWLTSWHQIEPADLSGHYYLFENRFALHHLFRVASGLDSMIIGEPQILGQVKMAYKIADDSGTVGNYLEKVFQTVFKVSKQVRGTTDIGKYSLSVASSAVNLARNLLKFSEKTCVLLIGSGDTIETVARDFVKENIHHFYIANRTREHAQRIAEQIKGIALSIDELYEKLSEVDIVISATACPVTIIDEACIVKVMQKRKQRPLIMIDLAVPRDIDPKVGNIPSVHLFNIDHLQDTIRNGLANRQEAAKQAELIFEKEIDQFELRQNSQQTIATICHYRSQVEEIRDQELAIALRRLQQGIDPETVLKKMAHRLTRKVMHQPSLTLRGTNKKVEVDEPICVI